MHHITRYAGCVGCYIKRQSIWLTCHIALEVTIRCGNEQTHFEWCIAFLLFWDSQNPLLLMFFTDRKQMVHYKKSAPWKVIWTENLCQMVLWQYIHIQLLAGFEPVFHGSRTITTQIAAPISSPAFFLVVHYVCYITPSLFFFFPMSLQPNLVKSVIFWVSQNRESNPGPCHLGDNLWEHSYVQFLVGFKPMFCGSSAHESHVTTRTDTLTSPSAFSLVV